jgi:aryl-alcohol dehydrogenase-like predicted oxidoreductase
MEYRKLGRTNIDVSSICLGTMTWGEQNTETDAHEQLDYSFNQGVNFIDTAEMYAVPTKEKTQGLTEKYIGTWLKAKNNRDKVILATKVSGRSGLTYLRENEEMTRLSREHIHYAVNKSLERLQTDYIDLYQVHWPERPFGAFTGKLEYRYSLIPEDTIEIEETLSALGELVQEGKIRHIGLSNETPWGTMKYLELSKTKSLPRVASIQNAYNLVNRAYEVGLSEITNHEQVGLLSYSPLGQGILTGKYLNGQMPEGSRLALFGDGPFMYRYKRATTVSATEKYVEIAKKYEIDPAQLAIRFCDIKKFMTSTIIGATTMDQLKACIGSVNVDLTKEILKEINQVHEEFPHPAP